MSYFGPFDAFWAGDVPRHLHLMHLHASQDGEPSFTEKAIAILKKVIAQNSAEEVDVQINKMLSDLNWRSNLMGAVCALLVNDGEKYVPLTWKRLSERTWASPQLVITAAALDKEFRFRALAQLRCNFDLLQENERDQKYLSALWCVLSIKFPDDNEVRSMSGREEIKKLGTEFAEGKMIAEKSWLKEFDHFFPLHPLLTRASKT
ncbi:MAG TPA: hypothetical protein VI112_15780 [Bacteroidia bacterium]|jgi:hypothetical protein